jgi:hypothetical protein
MATKPCRLHDRLQRDLARLWAGLDAYRWESVQPDRVTAALAHAMAYELMAFAQDAGRDVTEEPPASWAAAYLDEVREKVRRETAARYDRSRQPSAGCASSAAVRRRRAVR